MHGQNWAQALASGRVLRERISPLLTTSRFGRSIVHYREIGSTNAVAAAWAADGAPEGAVVSAEHQHAGRGRLGRTWHDEPGTNLIFTVILRPQLRPERLGLIILAASVAVAESVHGLDSALAVEIKWPNDVLVRGRKICGMLMETTTQASGTRASPYAALGIGLNVNQDSFPEEFSHRSSSLALEAGRIIERDALMADVLNRLERHYDQLTLDDGRSIRRSYTNRLAGLNEEADIFASGSREPLRGFIRGIADDGSLLLETSAGIERLASGDVSFRSPVRTR